MIVRVPRTIALGPFQYVTYSITLKMRFAFQERSIRPRGFTETPPEAEIVHIKTRSDLCAFCDPCLTTGFASRFLAECRGLAAVRKAFILKR